jgi:hypothetical protein
MAPVPSTKVNVSSKAGGIRCTAVSAVSAAAVTVIPDRTATSSLARLKISASTPPTSAKSTAGRV